MAKGKSNVEGGGKKRGRPATTQVSRKKEDDIVLDRDEAGSDEDEEMAKKEDNTETGKDLPVAPLSVQAVKKILIAPKELRACDWENVEEIYLKHPRTNNKSLFLLCTKSNNGKQKSETFQMFEVLTMQQETRSWFINNSVISDGNVYVCTPIDPLFLILPILAKSSKTKPIADHLSESSWPPVIADIFAKNMSHKQLENITIKKGCDDIIAFAYSEDNAISWMSAKAEKMAKYLSAKGISLTESSVSSNFVTSSVNSTSDKDCLRYACDIIGEYIDDNLKRKLLEKSGLPVLTEKTGVKRKTTEYEETMENEGSTKKAKTLNEDNVPLEDYGSKNNGTPLTKVTKITTREKELQKAAQGSHSLFKFFSAKSK